MYYDRKVNTVYTAIIVEETRRREENEKINKQLEEETAAFKKVLNDMGTLESLGCQIGAVAADTAVNTIIPGFVLSHGISKVAASASNTESILCVGGYLAANFAPGLLQAGVNAKQETEKTPDQFEEHGITGRAQGLKNIVQNLSKSFKNDTTLDLMALQDQQLLNNAQTTLDFQADKIQKSDEEETKEKLLKVCKKIKKLITGMEKAEENKDSNVIDLHEACKKIEEK